MCQRWLSGAQRAILQQENRVVLSVPPSRQISWLLRDTNTKREPKSVLNGIYPAIDKACRLRSGCSYKLPKGRKYKKRFGVNAWLVLIRKFGSQ
ncbi:hypothetical protein BELL_0599g00010 [Botrytis elliptica]|uniref:Uncharacterized protein n=1 Tax=Botrytis elliptica TaxID=278938 RepID=A0A4Z1JIC3_9HELO|nr:hypothetical protein BELL_0599g00010 [Botrytis elliptica]